MDLMLVRERSWIFAYEIPFFSGNGFFFGYGAGGE